jgi:hypothetical protein
MKKQLKNHPTEQCGVFGFFRVQVEDGPTGKIVGDSGWRKNRITDTGFQHYIVELMVGTTGSSRVTHAALGSGTEPGTTGTSLQGEHEVRQTTSEEASNSKTVRYTATFNSGLNFVTETATINNVGLFATSTQGSGSIFCGQTYDSSQIQTNQNVNVTYEIQFATA